MIILNFSQFETNGHFEDSDKKNILKNWTFVKITLLDGTIKNIRNSDSQKPETITLCHGLIFLEYM